MIRRPHLGILVGLKSEAAIVRKFLPPPHPNPPHKEEGWGGSVTIAVSGARKHQAEEAASRLAAAGVNYLLSFGYAGGLDPACSPGTLLIPAEIRTGGPRYPADPAWHRDVTELLGDKAPNTAPLFGSDDIVASITEKSRLHSEFGASAVDMESHILAQAAEERGLPFLAIRVVLDPADGLIPPAATVSVNPDGSISGMALFRSIARNPRQLPALIALGRASKIAENTLLGCSRRCGPLGFGVG